MSLGVGKFRKERVLQKLINLQIRRNEEGKFIEQCIHHKYKKAPYVLTLSFCGSGLL